MLRLHEGEDPIPPLFAEAMDAAFAGPHGLTTAETMRSDDYPTVATAAGREPVARPPSPWSVAAVKIPLGRMATPEEVANVAAFLVSPRACFITGVNVVVDGALTSRVQH